MFRRALIVFAACAVLASPWAAAASAGEDHHHHDAKPCHPTKAQQKWAREFAHATMQTAERYQNVAMALADRYWVFVDVTRAIAHYVNYQRYFDTEVMNPKAPEALVYANTHSGPKLIGVMYAMRTPEQKPPDKGGCITQWHTHPRCKSPVGYSHIWEGDCPPGWTPDGRTEKMLHVWTVPTPGGPYAFDPHKKWNCWPRQYPC